MHNVLALSAKKSTTIFFLKKGLNAVKPFRNLKMIGTVERKSCFVKSLGWLEYPLVHTSRQYHE